MYYISENNQHFFCYLFDMLRKCIIFAKTKELTN